MLWFICFHLKPLRRAAAERFSPTSPRAHWIGPKLCRQGGGSAFKLLGGECIGKCIGSPDDERWGAGVETQKNVRGEIGGWGRVPFNETYAPSLSTIYDGA